MRRSPEQWLPLPEWEALVRGENCPLCAALTAEGAQDGYAIAVADLGLSRLKLARNQFVPGYCILICRRHVRELHHLPGDDYSQFCEDMRLASLALERVFQPLKMNLEMLGNTVPHLHAHLVPRYHGDPAPGRPIDPTAKKVLLAEAEYRERVQQIRLALAHLSRPDRKVRCQGVIRQGDRLLLVRHLNHRTGRLYWWLPGGGLEAGETPEECITREIGEETGLEVHPEGLLFETWDPHREYLYERYLTYLCTPTGGKLAPGTEIEDSAIHSITGLAWVSLRDESGWESGFYEAHMLPLLRRIQAGLKL